MNPIATAIVLIQLAREQLDQELWARGMHYATKLKPDDQDLTDVVEDIGTVLHTLESFGEDCTTQSASMPIEHDALDDKRRDDVRSDDRD